MIINYIISMQTHTLPNITNDLEELTKAKPQNTKVTPTLKAWRPHLCDDDDRKCFIIPWQG